jgi:hypothetical protein
LLLLVAVAVAIQSAFCLLFPDVIRAGSFAQFAHSLFCRCCSLPFGTALSCLLFWLLVQRVLLSLSVYVVSFNRFKLALPFQRRFCCLLLLLSGAVCCSTV